MKQIVAFLRKERERQSLTQVQLSEKLGWSQRALSHIELGQRKLTLADYCAISLGLGLDPGEALSKLIKPRRTK